jgi:energy-coupling factor transporter ATP-binding protein EcfA2
MIEIRDLSFGYGRGKKALDSISLKIKKGEFILLTGNSGSGKSTLARCLNSLVPNFYGGRLKGSVRVGGVEATNASTKEMSKKVGMLFQDPEAMFVSNSVESEVGFGHSKDVSGIMRGMGLWELRERNLQELSGGEKQRVALAAVLAVEPDVLVLDEPLSELDHGSAEKLMGLLKDLNKKGTTIILIEQRTERVYSYATREIVLDGGRFQNHSC